MDIQNIVAKKKESKIYVCKRADVNEYLSNNGFIPYKETRYRYNLNRIIWLYERNEELTKALDAYYENIKATNKISKRIFSKPLAIYLRSRGFEVIKTEVNINSPQYDVYTFEDTSAFRNAIKEYNELKRNM